MDRKHAAMASVEPSGTSDVYFVRPMLPPIKAEDAHLFELAKRGAEARLGELVQEAKYLIDLFPHLRDSFDKDELPLPFIIAKGAGRVKRITSERPRGRRKSRMSVAVRKAFSERMKRYWAARRKAKQAGRKQAAKS
jgi:hypothetical protein